MDTFTDSQPVTLISGFYITDVSAVCWYLHQTVFTCIMCASDTCCVCTVWEGQRLLPSQLNLWYLVLGLTHMIQTHTHHLSASSEWSFKNTETAQICSFFSSKHDSSDRPQQPTRNIWNRNFLSALKNPFGRLLLFKHSRCNVHLKRVLLRLNEGACSQRGQLRLSDTHRHSEDRFHLKLPQADKLNSRRAEDKKTRFWGEVWFIYIKFCLRLPPTFRACFQSGWSVLTPGWWIFSSFLNLSCWFVL